jgi:hypothetical protein
VYSTWNIVKREVNVNAKSPQSIASELDLSQGKKADYMRLNRVYQSSLKRTILAGIISDKQNLDLSQKR